MAWYWWLILGMFIGSNVGFLMIGLCISAARADEKAQLYMDEEKRGIKD